MQLRQNVKTKNKLHKSYPFGSPGMWLLIFLFTSLLIETKTVQ